MSDGVHVGAKRGDRRATQSFSSAEAKMLVQALEQYASADSIYSRLLEKMVRTAKNAERAERRTRPLTRVQRVAARNQHIAADCEAAYRDGRMFNIKQYAAEHGLHRDIVERATRGVRRSLGPVPLVTIEAMFTDYKTLRLARMWHDRQRRDLPLYYGVPVGTFARLMVDFRRRYMAETSKKERRYPHGHERAAALLRVISGAGNDVGVEAAE